MTKKNILKIAIATSVATFTVLTHHNTEQQKLKHKKPIHIKTVDEVNKEIYDMWFKPLKDIKAKELAEKQRQEELKKQELIRAEEQKKKEESEWINLICTFYTGSADENGGSQNANKTASGKTLSRGIIASNAHKFGTKIYTKEFGTLTVEDRGNPRYIHQVNENTYRIDIYVSDKETAKRLGVMKIKGKIIK